MEISQLVLNNIQTEAMRAHEKHGPNSMYNSLYGDRQRYAILAEECGEVAHELNESLLGNRGSTQHKGLLYHELTQVAAMAITWMQAILDGKTEEE